MKYCPRCITPETRPNIRFAADGSCNCATVEVKQAIDWPKRERMFRELVKDAKRRSAGYDCVIPVSGGKDSTWQVLTCLEHGLKPLAVTWKAPARTPVGAANLANLISLGVDHVDFQISPHVEKRFMYEALVRCGSPAVPMHMAIFSIPLTFAVKFRIPLVIWGENSAFEYGGEEHLRSGFQMTSEWLKIYGGTFGTVASDWVGETLSSVDLVAYTAPTDNELAEAGVRAVFLGSYFNWDPEMSYRVACANGFMARPEGPKTGHYDFADIDDEFISIHHYLKWYKFGFTRLFDTLSLEIRNGRMTRDQAIEALRERGDQTPHEDIRRFCDYIGISVAHFFEVIERFRNSDVWEKRDGRWVIREFLVPNWAWS